MKEDPDQQIEAGGEGHPFVLRIKASQEKAGKEKKMEPARHPPGDLRDLSRLRRCLPVLPPPSYQDEMKQYNADEPLK